MFLNSSATAWYDQILKQIKIGREIKREREREKRIGERERNGDKEEEKACRFLFFKKNDVTLSPTTKIFVIENELTKKEIRV